MLPQKFSAATTGAGPPAPLGRALPVAQAPAAGFRARA